MRRRLLLAAAALGLPCAPAAAQTVRLAWSTGDAVLPLPARLAADSSAPAPLAWAPVRPGLDAAEAVLLAGRARIPVRVVVARLDPARFRLRLEKATRADGMTGAWSVDDAPPDAALAVNAGQFRSTGPWGWLVRRGREERDPGSGPLVAAVAVDTAGRLLWLDAEGVRRARARRDVAEAFQSYPVVLRSGAVPEALRRAGSGVDLGHRDARLLLCRLSDGGLLFALTRFDALGGLAARVPIGLTVPESAALAGALGCRDAVLLDGGISGQLLLRGEPGAARGWRGLRRVPLGLVALPAP